MNESKKHLPNAPHYLLKAYEEFQLCLRKTSMSDEIYLTYLYYSGVTCEWMWDSMENEMKIKLCEDELALWDKFYEQHNGTIHGMMVETHSDEEVEKVRNNLQFNYDRINEEKKEKEK